MIRPIVKYGHQTLHRPAERVDAVTPELQVLIDDMIDTMYAAEFVEREGMQLEEEGCLSVPGFTATVARPSRAVVKGLDRHGKELVVEGKDLLARAFQHEMDHLEGTLFVNRLRGIKRDIIVRKIQKLTRAGEW